ncbi:MAG: hypothetical protein HRT74_14430 [Flavobacteriales bacterium]|nr:hypothetical protein [Flavobacteriales bacterium]
MGLVEPHPLISSSIEERLNLFPGIEVMWSSSELRGVEGKETPHVLMIPDQIHFESTLSWVKAFQLKGQTDFPMLVTSIYQDIHEQALWYLETGLKVVQKSASATSILDQVMNTVCGNHLPSSRLAHYFLINEGFIVSKNLVPILEDMSDGVGPSRLLLKYNLSMNQLFGLIRSDVSTDN